MQAEKNQLSELSKKAEKDDFHWLEQILEMSPVCIIVLC